MSVAQQTEAFDVARLSRVLMLPRPAVSRYCQLERLLMWEFGLLALGLRRRAPAWSPVGAGRSMSTGPLDANASDAYLSAAPDPQSILRPHDRVYVLRAPPPKPAQEE